MKRIKFAILAAVAAALLAFPSAAFAESYTGSSDWTVTFTSGEQMVDTYSAKAWADDVAKLEPGDDLTVTVTLKHEHPTACDWYMSNEAIKSLETAAKWAASGSAYGYYLEYVNPAGDVRVLYDSNEVGGDDSLAGLVDATNALDDFFYLDTLSQGQTAKVNLKVTLDGETEGNAYFDTIAQLKMKWAVELTSNTPNKTTTTRNIVKTGDDTNLMPVFIAMVVSGVALLGIGIASVRSRKRENEHTGNHAQ